MPGDFKSAAIIGLGLIGGSIAAALKSQQVHVTAFDLDKNSLREGLAIGVIDKAADSIQEAVSDVDLVVIAIPVLAMSKILPDLEHLFDSDDVVLTDVGSVKASVVTAFEGLFGRVPNNFIPGHPIAGSEKHGVGASNAKLFEHHKVILTPLENTAKQPLSSITAMWQAFGADVTEMSVQHHDLVLAQTSHLPHLLAFALIDTLSMRGDSLEVFDYAAGGLRDFSRIAASDPTMWRDIFESNREPLLEVLERYQSELADLKALIQDNKLSEVHEVLTRAKTARDHFSKLLAERQK